METNTTIHNIASYSRLLPLLFSIWSGYFVSFVFYTCLRTWLVVRLSSRCGIKTCGFAVSTRHMVYTEGNIYILFFSNFKI